MKWEHDQPSAFAARTRPASPEPIRRLVKPRKFHAHTYTDTGKASFSSPSTSLLSLLQTGSPRQGSHWSMKPKKGLVTKLVINARSFWTVQLRPIPFGLLLYTNFRHSQTSLPSSCSNPLVAKNKLFPPYCATFLLLALVPLHGIVLTPHDQFRSVESFKFCCTDFPLGSHTTGNLLGLGRRGRPCLHCASGARATINILSGWPFQAEKTILNLVTRCLLSLWLECVSRDFPVRSMRARERKEATITNACQNVCRSAEPRADPRC